MKEYPVLYKYNDNGKVVRWQVISDGDSYRTISGQEGGKLTVSKPTVCYGKNLGKKNETSPILQAGIEALAKFHKKEQEGYCEVLGGGRTYIKPMLAKEHTEVEIDFRKRVFIQPKLDGIRAISEISYLSTRNGLRVMSCPHLYQNTTMLDGELYSHTYKHMFGEIMSLVKKQTPTVEQLAESEKMIQHWVYDFPLHIGPFSERYEALKAWYKKEGSPKSIVIVPTFEVESWDDINEHHGMNMEEGYEGSIIRIDDGPYEYKRSKQLLKYKDFTDSEFEIIGYEEGQGGRAGTIGKFLMAHDIDRRADFKSNVKGNHKFLAEVWRDRDTYIGMSATVKHFGRTPLKEDGTGNKPRHPFIIKFDRESYE